MSTTSCPRCRGQVTLPVGASNSSRVRCPLCHAHYTLAEALVNMPPLLEVVDEADEAASDWFSDSPSEAMAIGSPTSPDEALDEALDLDLPQPAPTAASPAVDNDETIEFAAEEALDEELEAEEADAGNLTYSSSGAPTIDLPLKAQPAQAAADIEEADIEEEDNALDFGPPQSAPAAESHEAAGGADDDIALDFGARPSTDPAHAETIQFEESGDEMTLDFDQPQATADDEAATLDFGPPQSQDSADDVQFDFDEQPASAEASTVEFASEEIQFADDEPQEQSAGAQALGEFGDVRFEASGEEGDIPLDLPAEAAAAPAADDAEAEETSGKKKRKQKKQKAAGENKPRSLVGTLARVAVSLLVAVPIALYVAMWISPGFDVVGLGEMLPSAMVPSGYKKYKAEQLAKSQPPAKGVDIAALAASANFRPPADAPANEAEPTGTEEPTDTGEPAADAAPALEPGVTPEGEKAPADDPFAPAPTPEEMPDDAAAPADDPAGEPKPAADDPFAPAEVAAEPAKPADDDPFAPAAPAKEPAAEPGKEPSQPPTDDPFADPPAKSDEPPAAESPAASRATPELPGASPAPAEEAPAADESDPFATPPSPDEPAPAEEKPAADVDDLFAPDKPAEKPAGDTETLPAPDAPPAPAKMLGPRNAQKLTLPQVMGTMQATQAAGQQLAAAETAGDPAALSKARANFYVTLFDMAGAITLAQLGPGGAQLDPQLQALEPVLRQQLTADPKRFESLKLFGARWFAFPKRTNNGVVLGGTVESVDHAGDLYHTRIKPGKADTASVTIVSAKDPAVAAGDEVLTLGSIVETPQDQLAGYEGSEPSVVWSGMTIKIAPPGN